MTEEIIARLRSLDLSGGSYSRLSAIAACFLEPAFGWTRGACEELRNMLIKLLEDADGNDDYDHAHDCNCNHHCCDQRQMSYDELGTTLSDLYGIWQDGEKSENRDSESARKMTKSAETINLGDESDSELMENGENHKFDGRITDELREYNNKQIKWLDMTKVHYRKLFDIADRIDEHVRQLERDVEMWRGRAEDMRMERDELREKCDRLKEKVEHQREQLAVYATMCDFDAIRALKRERNEHKHRADNAEGHVKSLERRLDAAHETYCALLNDAAREFRALTEERDELQSKLDDYDKAHVELPKDDSDEYIYIGDVMDGYGKTIEVVELRYERSGWVLISKDGNEYANTFAFEHHREPTVEQVIRDLTLGKITEAQAIERIEGING